MSDPVTIEQYCSVCKSTYAMTVQTGDESEDGIVWLQCPNCKGFLPKVSSSADLAQPADDAPTVDVAESDATEAPAETISPTAGEEEEAGDAATTDDDVTAAAGPPDFDPDDSRPYRPWESYAIEDVIHHLAWDDFGVVTAKEILPGDRKVVRVHFTNAGVVRLIEDDGNPP